MGQAFDREGQLLSEAYGATKKEVFDTLMERHGDAAEEIRIRTLHPPSAQELMPTSIPSIGRIVHYCLTEDDAAQINRRRTTGERVRDRMSSGAWPAGAQAHIGNGVGKGDVFPMLIVRVWGNEPSSPVNGQVFLDGNDVFWVTSVSAGEGPHTFSWPARV